MELVIAVVIGTLFACALYLMLRRSVVKLVMGLVLLSHAASLVILAAGGLQHKRAPVLSAQYEHSLMTYVDPLPQALILTAIVISFGVLAFALVLVYQTYHSLGTDDFDQMQGEHV